MLSITIIPSSSFVGILFITISFSFQCIHCFSDNQQHVSNFRGHSTTAGSRSLSILVKTSNKIKAPFVTVGFGTPKQNLKLIVDTGSHVNWINWVNCNDRRDRKTTFSRSLKYIHCPSDLCSKLNTTPGFISTCHESKCAYNSYWMPNKIVHGYLTKEKLSLTRDIFYDFLFGCNRKSNLHFKPSGILALGVGSFSFVQQIASLYGHTFSYCIPSSSVHDGYLIFGKASIISTGYTPLDMLENTYGLDIVGVKVDGYLLPVNMTISSSTANAVMDSRIIITRLTPAVYKPVRDEFRRKMGNSQEIHQYHAFDTCYDKNDSYSTQLPSISFVFEGGVEVVIDQSGIMHKVNSQLVCFAFKETEKDSKMVFGSLAQRTMEIVYDVGRKRIGFGPRRCR